MDAVEVASWLEELPVAPAVLDSDVRAIVQTLESAAADAVRIEREATGVDPGPGALRLPKSRLAALGRCERSAWALAGDTGAEDHVGDALLKGLAYDRFVIHHLRAGRVLDPARDLGDILRADGEWAVLHELDERSDRDPAALDELLGPVATTVEEAWSGIGPEWMPRTQSRVTVALAGARVVCSGVLDVVLGGPPTDRPSVLVEVKSGQPSADHVAEIGHYALLVTVRDGVAPAAVGRWYPGRPPAAAPVSAGSLGSAARRAADGILRWAELRAGRTPQERPGRWCSWCPDSGVCPSAEVAMVVGASEDTA